MRVSSSGDKFNPLSPNASTALALDTIDLFDVYLFPIAPGAKFPPLIKSNLVDASNDPVQIKAWVKKFSKNGVGPNWGIALKKSKLFVVDVDTNTAKGKVGAQTYADLEDTFGFPPTYTVTTPSGGFHRYYKGEHVFALGKYGLGVDVDAPNYVLIAGCVFKDGTSYRVSDNSALAPAPEWFYERIKNSKKDRQTNAGETAVELDQPQYVKWAIDYLKNDAEPSIEGKGGEQTTFKVAASLRDNGISQAKAVELMMEFYNIEFVCEPLWEAGDLARKVRNAYAYANLSMIGGKTAEADFSDTVDEDKLSPKEQAKSDKIAKKRGKKDDPWNTDCAVIVSPASFIDTRTKKMLSSKSFNNRYGAIGGHEAHKVAMRSKHIARYEGVCYRPGSDIVCKIEGRDHFNTYRAQDITPLDGDPKRFLHHMRYLVPDEAEREHLLDWTAWLVQHPDRKTMFAPLLVGATRTGKSFIAELMKVILGKANCSEPNKKRVASDFNGWLASKQFVVIHELREKGARGLYDVLKELITQKTVPVNLKGIEPFEIENFANFFTISNHEDALPLDDHDGRYLVVRCADEPFAGRGSERSKVYYTRLFDCIGTTDAPGDEARRVLGWLQRRDIKLNCENVAPETEAKSEMVEASRSNLEKYLHNALEIAEPPFHCPIINSTDALNALPIEVETHSRTLRAVEMALREIGARPLRVFGQVRTASGRKRLWALDGRRVSHFAGKTPNEIANIYDAGRSSLAKLKAAATAGQVSDYDDEFANDDDTISPTIISEVRRLGFAERRSQKV